jgi:hypothetical protein
MFRQTLQMHSSLDEHLYEINYTEVINMYSCGHGILEVKFMSIQKMSM